MKTPVTSDISEAVRILRQGRLVAFPTGTAYGLAADAQQGFALQRLRNLKKRPAEKTFTVCLSPTLWSEYFLLAVAERQLLETLSGHKLTVLLTPKKQLEHLAQDGRVGLRLVDHPVMKELVEAFAGPLTATSANLSGQAACFSPSEIEAAFPATADGTTYNLSVGCIVDGGSLPSSQPSTIINLEPTPKKIRIVRLGAVSLPELSGVVKRYGWEVERP